MSTHIIIPRGVRSQRLHELGYESYGASGPFHCYFNPAHGYLHFANLTCCGYLECWRFGANHAATVHLCSWVDAYTESDPEYFDHLKHITLQELP